MTAQCMDTIRFEAGNHGLCALPLDAYFEKNPGKRPSLVSPHTANWRGYEAAWALEDGRLYLVGFQGFTGERTLGLEDLFPGSGGRVFASWYTGELRIVIGECVQYVHMGFGSTYEKEAFVTIAGGVSQAVRRETHEDLLEAKREEEKREAARAARRARFEEEFPDVVRALCDASDRLQAAVLGCGTMLRLWALATVALVVLGHEGPRSPRGLAVLWLLVPDGLLHLMGAIFLGALAASGITTGWDRVQRWRALNGVMPALARHCADPARARRLVELEGHGRIDRLLLEDLFARCGLR